MKKSLTFILALALLIGLLPAVHAAGPTFSASPVGKTPESEKPISAVDWWYSTDDQCYYLFLPAEADCDRLQVWPGTNSCILDGTSLRNGTVTDRLTVGAHTLLLNGIAYPLQVMQSANIPAMYITTESGSMSNIHKNKSNKEKGYLRMVNEDGSVVYNNTLSQIKGRGNATWSKPKKPYQIKLDKSTDLIGAGKCKTWLLLANYSERSLIRNKVAYDLANDAGLPNTTQSCFVDLYCNNQYMGTYQLCEKVQINDNRIEINDLEESTEDCNEGDLDSYPRFGPNKAETGSRKGYEIPNNPDDITGGYLLELEYLDRYENEVSGFVTTRGQPVVIKSPEYATREQVDYIADFFQEFEDALYSPDGVNPDTGKRYDEYFDLTSLARKYILEEYVKNIDANVTSQYFYKPSDTESTVGYCGPVWDYDNALGNFSSAKAPTGLLAASKKGYTYYFHMLYQQPSFLNAVRAEWNNNYLPLIEMCLGDAPDTGDTLLRPLDEYQKLLSPSAAMNFTYWNILDSLTSSGNNTGRTYEENFAYLRSFMEQRAAYLSSLWSVDDIAALPTVGTLASDNGMPNILQYDGAHSTYIVDSAESLQAAADLVSAGNTLTGVTLLQTADITLTEPFRPGGDNQDNANIITLNTVFKGTFNGQGYSISGLTINLPEQNGVGIFAAAYQATFIDVHVTDGTVTGFNRVAALAGYGDKCTFIRCSNGAAITSRGGGDGVAGLAGVARESAVFHSCYNTGAIHAEKAAAAGLAGWGQANITLENCYNAGAVTSPGNKAALTRTNGIRDFSTCYYSDASVATDTNNAQIFQPEALTDGTLTAALNQSAEQWEVGETHPVLTAPERTPLVRLTVRRLMGERVISTASYSYPAGDTATLKPENNVFVTNWTLNGAPAGDTAVLTEDGALDIYLSLDAESVLSYHGVGDYYIADAKELQAFLTLTEGSVSGSRFYLLTDIDARSITASGGVFDGILNGKYARITGLTVPLFRGVAKGGDVRKLCFANADLQGEGVVADVNNGRIAYIATENIALRGNTPGGITGVNNGNITACSVGGYVIAEENAGGVAGVNNGVIQSCCNNARLIALQGTAGGMTAENTGLVESGLNMGMINAKARIAMAGGHTENCYFWDWCVGDAHNETPCTDAQIANPAFLEQLPAVYWEQGTKFPQIRKLIEELGDVNRDEQVTLSDEVRLLRYLSDLIPEEQISTVAADIDGDGVSTADVILILQYLNKMVVF